MKIEDIEFEFNFEDIVFLKTDPLQLERIVTCYILRPHSVVYELSCGTDTSVHCGFEISEKQDMLKIIKNQN